MRYKKPLFNKKSNRFIKRHMKKWKNYRNRFAKISRLLPKYTGRQISNHWRNYLDPRLCQDPLDDNEKNFIIEQAQSYQNIIHWKYVLDNLKNRFGKYHSENKVKNFWYSRKKCHSRKAKTEEKQEARIEEQKQEARTEARIEGQVDSSGYSKIPVSSLLNFNSG